MAPGASSVQIINGTNATDIVNAVPTPAKGVAMANELSCSWGGGGGTEIDQGLMQMALQGQSFFLCSGNGSAPPNGIQPTDQDYDRRN